MNSQCSSQMIRICASYICYDQVEGKVDVLLTIIEEIWQNTISSLPRKDQMSSKSNNFAQGQTLPCSYLENLKNDLIRLRRSDREQKLG